MAVLRTSKRRAAGVASAKILITSASVAATIGGWAAISAMPQPTAAASLPTSQLGAPDSSQAPSTAQLWPGERRRRHFGQGGTAPFGQPAPQENTPGLGQQTAPSQPRRPITSTHSSR